MALSAIGIGLGFRGNAKPQTERPVIAEKGLPSIRKRYTAYADEGARLTDACMTTYWDASSRMYRAPVLSAETVPSDGGHDRGYVLWPSLIAIHTLIEGEAHSPGKYTKRIAEVYAGLEQYFSEDLQAYTAWMRFPENIDAYYDDNAWVVIILVEAHLACRKHDGAGASKYLARAKAVMANYLVKGWDDTGHPGGMRWGYDPAKPNTSDRGTSSTAGSALAAMMLARAGVDTAHYTQWGLSLLDWLKTNLTDADGLVMDAMEKSGDVWKARTIKWSYNTGVPMRAYIEHYRLTKSADSLAMAEKLARAAIKRDGALFDQTPHDPDKRFYWDGTYFVQYLVDGLVHVAATTHDRALSAAIAAAVVRNTEYAHNYLRDATDGFYWRNWRLYTIGEAQLDTWQKWTGQTAHAEFDASERSQEKRYQALPVKDRPLVKTLLANAGAARLFWLSSRLPGTPGEGAPDH